jgi:uncharacterized delta-60 repeat protein
VKADTTGVDVNTEDYITDRQVEFTGNGKVWCLTLATNVVTSGLLVPNSCGEPDDEAEPPLTITYSDGSLDLAFNPGKGANDTVRSTALQSDGKLVIGGEFTYFDTTARTRIARLNADGTLDTNFNPGSGANLQIESVVIQSDGKMVVGGSFTTFDGVERNRIARLNADGSIDETFNPGGGANNRVNTIALQSDGKLLIGGLFTSYDGVERNRIARLNANGSLDATFNPGTGAGGSVNAIALQSDGKVLIGGGFTTYNGTTRNRIARVNANGTLDTAVYTGTGANSDVSAIVVRSDGKVLIGGAFTTYNGTTRNRIARLNANGTLDTGLDPGTGANASVLSIALQSDGKLVVGGQFSSYDGTARGRVARLNANGTLDTSFDVGTGVDSSVWSVALRTDGVVHVGGGFTTFNGALVNRIASVNADGSLETSFNPGRGPNLTVSSFALQPDGKVMVGGDFTTYDSLKRNRVARLNADGSLDTSFNPGTGASDSVRAIAMQSDGKLLIGGSFTSYDGTARNRVARLNADGTLDTSFVVGTGVDSSVWSVALQPDGKILIGGDFTSYDGTARGRVARLNADGTLDGSFTPGAGADARVWSVALQPDGKVLIGGDFTSYGNTSRNGIARLNADGSLDTTFGGSEVLVLVWGCDLDGTFYLENPTGPLPGRNETRCAQWDGTWIQQQVNVSGANGTVSAMSLQADGKVLIGGGFTSYDNTSRGRIARLNADGTLDGSFNTGTGANGTVSAMSLQADGKVLIGGDFTSYGGTSRGRIARLNADGSLDTTFNPGTGASSSVTAMSLQTDGSLLIGGSFSAYSDTPVYRVARLVAAP